eukprot:TRINITY_DN2181_c2_g1_i1.p1 TRINITY_DN2181_c2_g1~~TRINITY_DN2181_c2_g1_i1.p1  ORF type:complete len:337 (+),score=117.98 TRINITY_DN2181_c2_g1_i1:25-1035(+)
MESATENLSSELNKKKKTSSSTTTTSSSTSASTESSDNIQDLLSSKIAEIENGNTKDEEDEKRIAKVVAKEMKEMKIAIDSIATMEERYKAVTAKYMQLLYDIKRQDRDLQSSKRQAEKFSKEKDLVQTELVKTNGVKVKLETLCRELQKQNKQVMEGSKRIATEEQEKRQELSKKFHNTIKEITTKMEEQNDERMKQLKENDMLREKFKNFAEQYEVREQHFATQIKAKDLEQQLLEAKLKQQADIALQEALKAQAYKEQTVTLVMTENELRAQLSLYAEKFEQFQDTLTKSNDVFTTFKQEMQRMTKTIKKLEKENIALKKKNRTNRFNSYRNC